MCLLIKTKTKYLWKYHSPASEREEEHRALGTGRVPARAQREQDPSRGHPRLPGPSHKHTPCPAGRGTATRAGHGDRTVTVRILFQSPRPATLRLRESVSPHSEHKQGRPLEPPEGRGNCLTCSPQEPQRGRTPVIRGGGGGGCPATDAALDPLSPDPTWQVQSPVQGQKGPGHHQIPRPWLQRASSGGRAARTQGEACKQRRLPKGGPHQSQHTPPRPPPCQGNRALRAAQGQQPSHSAASGDTRVALAHGSRKDAALPDTGVPRQLPGHSLLCPSPAGFPQLLRI